MTDTITLTREQWESVWNGLDEIRDRLDELYDIETALSMLGMQKPADIVGDTAHDIAESSIRLQSVLMAADDATPSPAKSRAMPKWFWPLNKSNREA